MKNSGQYFKVPYNRKFLVNLFGSQSFVGRKNCFLLDRLRNEATPKEASFDCVYANLERMFQAIREATLREGADDSDGSLGLADLATVGSNLFSGISRFFSTKFDDEDRRVIANGIREFFNVTTPAPATPIVTEQPRFTFPYTRPYIHVREHTVATTPAMRTSSARIPLPTTASSTMPTSTFTTYSPVIIWPTTARTTTLPSITRTRFTWRPVTPQDVRFASTSIPYKPDRQTYTTEASTTADNIPFIIKARKFTRPPPTADPTTTTSSYEPPSSCNRCRGGKRCQLNLRSFDTTDPVFQYAYDHSTVINDYVQTILREAQMTSFPSPLSWRNSVAPEVIQLTKSLISLYQPSRCLVIGVFTGLGLLGIAEEVEPRGLIIALEHPSLVQYWEDVGLKFTKMVG
ncbi:hypothetical protein ANCDUO_02909 [Ancylostoma duodenale]|uniref:Uncharacterized protein n=1 Tax=Ancylostoma duodenale TaxID=51022 RepID=A0A0C2H5D5_9BILA|nr:hypothetical protein ANCDUO_02909 [Ancylostoma duodenale]